MIAEDEKPAVTSHTRNSELSLTHPYQKLRYVYSVYPAIDQSQRISQQIFCGKCAIVTGASRGIGEDAAQAFARASASVVLVTPNGSQLVAVEARTLEEVPKARVLKIALDVTNPTEAEVAVARTVELFDGVDVLVTAADKMCAADRRASCIPFT